MGQRLRSVISNGFGNLRQVLPGIVCTVLITACGGGSGGGSAAGDPEVFVQAVPASEQRIIPTTEARAYRPSSPYASVLKECALADTDNICTLAELPYIGQAGGSLSVESVMERVVVTHDWMGLRFEQLLRRMPSDIVELFAPVTAIMIGSEIRPSRFSSFRGRINIDPRYFWMSVEEKRTISVAPDFRTEFGPDLKFRSFWRLASGDDYATPFHSLSDDSTREIDDLDISLARLLYHELAHANDVVQYNDLDGLPLTVTPRAAVELLEGSTVRRSLYDRVQLTAQTSLLYGLAGVRFFNDAPNEFESTVLADVVGSEMGNEGKAIFYGYSTTAEDVATLFAAAMMNYHYDVDYHVGLVNKPVNDATALCNDYKVEWGVRNRLASPMVAPRAKFVVDQMLRPSADRDQFFATGMGTAEPLQSGAGWCDSVSSTVQFAKQAKNAARPPVGLEAEHIAPGSN